MGNEHSKSKELLNRNGALPEKHRNGSANVSSNGMEIAVNSDSTGQQNSEPLSLNLATESNDFVIVESGRKPADAPGISVIQETIIQKEEVKESNENQTDVGLPATDPQTETADPKQESESLTEPESVTLDSGPEGEKADKSVENQEDRNPEKNPVMNFFKTIVTSKITKKETTTADATKAQSQREIQPAATTTVAQVSEPPAASKGMSIPPPPPPEPPKMEIKAEPAAKHVKPTAKEEPKAAAKEPESSKGKSAKDTLSRFFRSKVALGVKASKGKGASAPAKSAAVTNKDAPPQPAVEVEVQPVVEVQNKKSSFALQETPVEVPEPVVVEVKSENNVEPHETAEQVAQPVVEEQIVEEVPQPVVEAEKVDFSKAGTLEAAAKPEPPPPVQEAKKTASKSSFFSLFKPKAADPKKATSAPAAAVETVKAKEEPKAAAKSPEAVVDNKPASVASQTGGDAANAPKKLEKRNSINLFFKILGQKRNSTDAGIQTEPVTVAQAAEKAK